MADDGSGTGTGTSTGTPAPKAADGTAAAAGGTAAATGTVAQGDGTADGTGEPKKTGDGTTPAPKKAGERATLAVPDRYDLKAPEGLSDTETVERMATLARSLGLPNAAAQQALDFVQSEIKNAIELYETSLQIGRA